KVLIIGGGLGGLVLANRLQKYGVSFCVYERDGSETARIQGYLIGLNSVGIGALRESVSEEKFKRIESLFKPSQFAVADRNLEVLLKMNSGGTINRAELRSILLEGVPIQFGKRLESYREDETGVTVHFEDGTSERGDIVVGADGVRSSVRKQKLPDFTFADVNVFRVQALIPNVTKEILDTIFHYDKNAVVLKTLGSIRNTIIFGRTKNIQHAISLGLEDVEDIDDVIAKNQDNTEILLISYEWRPAPNETEPIPSNREDLLNLIRRDTQTYHPVVKQLLSDFAKPEHLLDSKAAPLTQASPIENFKTSRVTLLGDSIHCMTSHAGMGGNTAMKDGSELAIALKNIFIDKAPLEESLSSYQKGMLDRGFKAVNISRANTERMHAKEVGWFGEKIRNGLMKFFFQLIVLGIVKLD
ncbi:hypothetical protein DICPUDRAFT_41313, partial [Dictyostelium purpureum]